MEALNKINIKIAWQSLLYAWHLSNKNYMLIIASNNSIMYNNTLLKSTGYFHFDLSESEEIILSQNNLIFYNIYCINNT